MLTSKKAIRMIIVLSALCLGLFVAYLLQLSNRISDLQTSWKLNNQLLLEETRAIDSVLGQLGYTGYIHNFKNYVLRREPHYLLAMERSVERFNHNLATLQNLLTDKDSRQAIQVLRQTIGIYQKKAQRFSTSTRAMSAEQLDSQVRVDDTRAAQALEVLRQKVVDANTALIAENDARLAAIQRQIRYGNFVILAFVGLISLLLITLKRMQNANRSLNEAKGRIDMLIDASPGALLIVNQQGVITRVNKVAKDVFGCGEDKLIGQRVEAFLPASLRAAHQQYRQAFMQSDQNIAMDSRTDLKALTAEGTEFDVEISLNRTTIAGEPCVILNLRDVSKQRAVERAAEQTSKLEALGQLTAGVAHDFNNILMTIGGNAELIKYALPQGFDGVDSYIDAVNSAVSRASALNSRLLSFGRKQALVLSTMQVDTLLEELTNVLARSLGETINLELVQHNNLWSLHTDKAQLESAILNLCLNAKHAMPKGGDLIISAENAELNEEFNDEFGNPISGHFVMLSVSDTGHGISESILTKVFDPFFTTKETGKGSGLGLSMVYGFMNQTKGHIKIYSEEGIGTTVKLFIPAVLLTAEQALPSIDKPADKTASRALAKATILVIEDDDDVRAIPVRLLAQKGYEVLEAASPEEALKIAEQGTSIDLVFSDIVLSNQLNGVELYQRIKPFQPSAKVLFTTGYAHEDILRDIELSNNQHIITKPYSAQKLYAAIEQALD